MPIYEYKCSICSRVEERIETFSSPKERDCPNCKRKTMFRQISKTTFSLRGEGWFSDSYKGNKKNE